jgi:hypothetical protein
MRTSRRQFLKYGCLACSAGILFPASLLAQANNKNIVQDIKGSLLVNKTSAMIGQEIKAGDTLSTGVSSKATVLFGGDAYHLKENTVFVLPKDIDSKSSLVGGAVLAAFNPGKPKKIEIASKTVLSIRGTGTYIEVGANSSDFCLCYGAANLRSDKSDIDVITDTKFHKDFTILTDGEIRPTYWHERRLSHTSRQNIELEKIAGRPSPFDGGYRDWISQFEDPDL